MLSFYLPCLREYKEMEDGTKWSYSRGGELAKDGRKINVGDCALFEAENAPPLIGIIRSFSVDTKGQAKLSVNWLYRSPDIKLGKGVLLEAAPNEIFYSFHEDEIAAKYLLHPCKVAFLRKGVELPSGISSFVCRRVYDRASKCLWWLTDRERNNEHQEEVDQLLTRTPDILAATHMGGKSPRALNVHGLSQQMKSSSEKMQNGSFLFQEKRKKRECTDQNIDPAKRECSSKVGDSHAGHVKQGRAVRPVEIANITDKYGGLENSAGVEHLIHIMQEHVDDSAKRGTDLTSWRTMLVEVIANTNRDDCLNQFVQIGGLLIMDGWLQVAHKGKNSEAGSPKEGDTVDDELLLMLLHAFNKLPVDLNALKKSSVGKSVNLLRSHKNSEIKKRAKFLVDAWKKRVAAELKISDTISESSQGASCPCNQVLEEEVHLQCKNGGSSKAVHKDSSTLPTKVNENTSRLSESGVTESCASPRSVEESSLHSSVHGYKDCNCNEPFISGTTDILVPSRKEEKSTSSSQSQNNSPSCSSCLGKASASFCRGDSKSSVAVSSSTKALSLLFHHSTSSKDITGSAMPGKKNESVVGESLGCGRHTECEAVLQSGVTCDNGGDAANRDNIVGNQVAVRFPNTGDCLACDMPAKPNVDIESLCNVSLQINTEFKKSTGNEAGATQNDDGYRSFTPNHVEECIKSVEEAGNLMKTLETDQPSSGLCEQMDPAEGLAEVETLIPGAQGRILATSMKYLSHAESTKLDIDEGGEKPLSCRAASEILKGVEVLPTSKKEITSLGTGDNKVDQDTKSRCYPDVISFHPDDSGNESILGTREGKDGIVCRDSPVTACNGLPLYSSVSGVTSQQKDALDLSALVLVTVSGTGGPSDSLMINSPSTAFHLEHKSDSSRMNVGPLYQDAEQCEAVLSGPNGKLNAKTKAEISGASRQLDSGKYISVRDVSDDKGQPRLHEDTVSMGEGNVQDVILEDNMEDGGTADRETIAKEHIASTKTLDSDISNLTKGTTGSTEESSNVVVQAAMNADQEVELYSVLSDKERLEVSTPYLLKNDQLEDTDIVHFRKQSTGVELEDGEKDERSGSQDVLDDIENVARKKKCMESTKMGVPGEHKQVEQAAYISVSDNSKLLGTELKRDSLFHKDERSSAIKESEDPGFPRLFVSNVGVKTDGAVPMGSSTHQTLKCLARTADVTELDASEGHATDVMMGIKRTSIDIGVPLRPEFDLNEGLAMDEANQDDSAIYATASASLTTTSGGLATKGHFVPLFNLVETKEQAGWKGSASRSAFQSSEPQTTSELQHPILQNALCDAVNNVVEKQRHNFLDIDLNVADKRVMDDFEMVSSKLCTQQFPFMKASEQMTETGQEFIVSTSEQSAFSGPSGSAGRLPFDLNCVSKSEEDGLAIAEIGHCINYSGSSVKAVSKGLLYGSSRILRDFDLNDGPCFEDAGNVPTPQYLDVKSNDGSYFPPVIGMRVNKNSVNGSSCSPVGNTFPAFTTPLFSSARTDPRPFPVDAAAAVQSISISRPSRTSSSAYFYNGEPTVATSHAAAHSQSTVSPFLAVGLSLGSGIPFSSTPLPGGMASLSGSPEVACSPTFPSQSISAGASSPCFRPSISLMEPSGMLTMPCLDLNNDPDTVMESREEIVDPRNPYTIESHISLEHKALHQAGGASVLSLKRKEPEGGWDSHRTGYKQATW